MAVKATVFIPTLNGEEFLEAILKMIFTQKVTFHYEVLVIDSGSTDHTLSIIEKYQKKHKNLRFHAIPNSEFSHGKTRNLAAKLAKGDYVVYLTHDAVPAHEYWLHEMVRPFEINPQIKGVFGRQIPRPFCCPLIKRDVTEAFRSFGPDYGITLCQSTAAIQDAGSRAALGFYSDVNSALPRKFNQETLPYRNVDYAEDQAYGKDLIDQGYIKVYTALGAVYHSNHMGVRQYKKRIFDEYIGLKKIGHTVDTPSLLFCLKQIVRDSLKDARFIVRDRDYSRKRKLYWLCLTPLYHIFKWQSVRKAARTKVSDKEAISKHSLEYDARTAAQAEEKNDRTA